MKYCPHCGHRNMSSLASKCESCSSSLTPKVASLDVTYNPTIKKEKKSKTSGLKRRMSKYNADDEDEDEDDDDEDEDYSDAEVPRIRKIEIKEDYEGQATVSRSRKLRDILEQ